MLFNKAERKLVGENKQISGKFGSAREVGAAAANPETAANIFIRPIFQF